MAVAYVQDTGFNAETTAFNTARSDSFATLPTVGNHVHVLVGHWRATSDYVPARVYDNQNNYYQQDIQAENSGPQCSSSIYCTKVVTSSGTFTVSWQAMNEASANNYGGWVAVEFSGIGGSNMPTFAGAQPGSIQTYTTQTSGTISRTLAAGSIWVVAVIQNQNAARSYSASGHSFSWSDTIGATTLSAEGGSNTREVHLFYAHDSAGGSRTCTITVGGGLSASFILTDFELTGIDTSTPGDIATTLVETGTNTSHPTTGITTSSNGGIGIMIAQSDAGNISWAKPSDGWNRVLGGNNAVQYYLAIRRSGESVSSSTAEFSHATARLVCAVQAWFKSASAATNWLDKTGSNSSTSGDATVTASGANASSAGMALVLANVSNNDADINLSDTDPTGYTPLGENDDASGSLGFWGGYKVYSASETSGASWSHDNTAQDGWTAVVATYRAAETGVNITPGQGNLALSATAPIDPRVAHLAAPAQGALALSATAPSVQQDHPLAPASADLVLSTTAPSLGGAVTISPDAGSLTISSTAPTRLLDHLILAAAASLALSTTAPDAPTQAHLTYPAAGTITLSATSPDAPLQAHLRYPGQGTLTLSATAPDLGGAIAISPDAGTLTLSTTAPERLEASLRYPSAGNLALSATTPSVSIASGISPAAGDLALSTTAPTVLQAHLASPAAVNLVLSMTAPSLDTGAAPTTGQLALSATAPTVEQAHLRYPSAGALTLTSVVPDVQGGAIQWTVFGVGTATRQTGTARAVRLTGEMTATRVSGLARAVRRET